MDARGTSAFTRVFQRAMPAHDKLDREPRMAELNIKVNGRIWPVDAAPDTPLLYVLTNELQLQGPRFGCGLAQCGSCSVLVNGVETRSCVTAVSKVEGKSVT